ncbi:hypothetical protein MRX96_041816 [Rhipicephalus microplus]
MSPPVEKRGVYSLSLNVRRVAKAAEEGEAATDTDLSEKSGHDGDDLAERQRHEADRAGCAGVIDYRARSMRHSPASLATAGCMRVPCPPHCKLIANV